MMKHVMHAAAFVDELEAANAEVKGAVASLDQVRFWEAVEDGNEVDAVRLGMILFFIFSLIHSLLCFV
jgi:hypothetical protein